MEGTITATIQTENSPELCPEGTYCLNGVYTNITNQEDPYSPRFCDTGANCPPGSTNKEGIIQCEIGYFCQAGIIDTSNTDVFQKPEQCVNNKCKCPKGYYCPSNQLTLPIICPKGKYMPDYNGSACLNCPEGYFCPWSLNISPKQAFLCDQGNRCPGNQSSEIQCLLGQYQNNTGQTFCNDCEPGAYGSDLGLALCYDCNQSYYCPNTGMTSPLPCPAQYYCYLKGLNSEPLPINQSMPDVLPLDLVVSEYMSPQPCPRGNYCPSKSGYPIMCPVGSYQSLAGSITCSDCLNGRMCSLTGLITPLSCPAGFYCINNKQFTCPAGYYCLINTETGDPNSDSLYKPLPCPAGTYCTGGNTSGNTSSTDIYSAQPCSQGLYNNKSGQSSCTICPAGYECTSSGMLNPIICAQGSYRPSGLSPLYCVYCPEGTYNPHEGSTSLLYCINCDAGIVCNSTGAVDQKSSYPCPAGYYCPSGTSPVSRTDYPCSPGYYCVPGTKDYNDSLSNLCPSGRYCSNATAADYVEDCSNPSNCNIGTICQSNFYCPEGCADMIPCPDGTTSNDGAFVISNCTRAGSTFYKSKIVKSHIANSISGSSFSYYELNLTFLNYFANASIPQDYQLSIKFSFLSKNRRLQDSSVTNLLVSNSSYGTKLGVPLIFSSSNIFESGSNIALGIQLNVDAEIQFFFQFLNSTFNSNYG